MEDARAQRIAASSRSSGISYGAAATLSRLLATTSCHQGIPPPTPRRKTQSHRAYDDDEPNDKNEMTILQNFDISFVGCSSQKKE